TGVIWAAWYMLAMIRQVLFGPVIHAENAELSDLVWVERIVLLPIIILIVWIGVYPTPFLRRMEASVDHVIVQVERRQASKGSEFMFQGRWAKKPESISMDSELSRMNPDASALNSAPSTMNKKVER
ncbi:MAG: hypothetical protein U9R33_04740, partial [candidate division NC10 bacterium]|nr:hypothetical protein [candidate division NC10 bacterium]